MSTTDKQRVGRRLDPDQRGLGQPRGFERVEIAQIARRPRDAESLVHPGDEAERAAVRVVRDDDVVTGLERAQDRVLGRETARERETVPRTFERRDARLHRGARGIAAARVLVAAVLAYRLLHERRGQTDRRHDRAGVRVGILARVDRARLETVAHADVRVARKPRTSERVSTPIG